MGKYNRAQQKAVLARQIGGFDTHTATRVAVKEVEVKRTLQQNVAWGVKVPLPVVVRRVG